MFMINSTILILMVIVIHHFSTLTFVEFLIYYLIQLCSDVCRPVFLLFGFLHIVQIGLPCIVDVIIYMFFGVNF